MRLATLLNTHTTVDAWQDKLFTSSAHLSPVFLRDTHSGRHSDFSGKGDVALCQLLVFTYHVSSLLEKLVNTFRGYPSV
jgi:hypothetical protein